MSTVSVRKQMDNLTSRIGSEHLRSHFRFMASNLVNWVTHLSILAIKYLQYVLLHLSDQGTKLCPSMCVLFAGKLVLRWTPIKSAAVKRICLCPTCKGTGEAMCLNCLGETMVCIPPWTRAVPIFIRHSPEFSRSIFIVIVPVNHTFPRGPVQQPFLNVNLLCLIGETGSKLDWTMIKELW